MEMEVPTPQAAPIPVQSPPVMPVPMQQPPSPAPAVQFDNGGATNSTASFFKSLNWIEIGFMILGATAMLFTIKYYREKAVTDKANREQTQMQLDEVKMNLQTAMKGKYKTL